MTRTGEAREHRGLGSEQLGFERLVFFSDAVFAIAMTLLVVDLRLPETAHALTGPELDAELGKLLPRVFAYVLSFAVVGLYWIIHWGRFQMIERADGVLVTLNVVVLGLVAFIPFPTALIGEHGDQPQAVVIYGVSLGLAGLAGPIQWLYAARAGLLRPDVHPDLVGLGLLRGLVVPAVMLGSLALLPVLGPFGVELSWFLIAPLQVILSVRIRRVAQQPGGA